MTIKACFIVGCALSHILHLLSSPLCRRKMSS